MARPKGSTAWAILRLRNEASQLRERGKDPNSIYSLHQRTALLDAAAAADRMAASIEAGDHRRLYANNREFDRFIEYAGYAVPMGPNYGRSFGHNPVDEIADTWEKDHHRQIEREEERPYLL